MKSQKDKDIDVIRLKEYNPPTNLSDNFVEYHNGFINAFYSVNISSPYSSKFQANEYEAWNKGYEDGLDATARPR